MPCPWWGSPELVILPCDGDQDHQVPLFHTAVTVCCPATNTARTRSGSRRHSDQGSVSSSGREWALLSVTVSIAAARAARSNASLCRPLCRHSVPVIRRVAQGWWRCMASSTTLRSGIDRQNRPAQDAGRGGVKPGGARCGVAPGWSWRADGSAASSGPGWGTFRDRAWSAVTWPGPRGDTAARPARVPKARGRVNFGWRDWVADTGRRP